MTKYIRKLWKTIVSLLLSVVILAALATVAGFMWMRSSIPDLSGVETVAGLTSDVEIVYDRNGVPHIHASTADDAYRALGFVHARDRLFQMDFMRRLGAGRLSEVVGAQTVGVDRTMRTLGLYRLAEATVDRLPPAARAHLDAYAGGVNAYLATRSGALPPEFLLLGYTPAPWRPADSLVWGRLMALRLSGNWQTEALRLALAKRLSAEQIADLWPREDGGPPPTIALAPGLRQFAELFADLAQSVPDPLRQMSASNSWAIGSDLTASGRPLLANDPHLGFQAPAIWYLARIEAPGLSVTGATVPGVPFHVLGHNGRIAWAFTTTDSDTQDLFIERLSEGRPGHYDAPGGPAAFVERTELVRVKNAAPVELKVRETRHGPVISDLNEETRKYLENGHVIALSAAALLPDDDSALGLLELNRSTDWQSFRAALAYFHTPQQNVTYADIAANIGFLAAGRVPVRASGDGSVPVPGWDGTHDWTDFIPFDALPQVFTPASGRIVNANHRIVGPDYPWHLTHDWAEPYRAQRIFDRLDSGDRQTPEAAARLQTDILSGAATSVLPVLLGLTTPADARAARARDILRGWNGEMRRPLAAPLIFTAWLAETNRGLYSDELGPHFDAFYGLRPRTVLHMVQNSPQWCDVVSTPGLETCADIVGQALDRALDDLAARYGRDMAAWRWGEAHTAHFRHPVFGHLPILRSLADIRIESDGGAYTVNRGQNRISDGRAPYASVHGPGFRAIYDLSDLARSRFALATGQSGNPLSDRYDDMTEGWRDGRYVTIVQSRADAIEGARGVLKLEPRR